MLSGYDIIAESSLADEAGIAAAELCMCGRSGQDGAMTMHASDGKAGPASPSVCLARFAASAGGVRCAGIRSAGAVAKGAGLLWQAALVTGASCSVLD